MRRLLQVSPTGTTCGVAVSRVGSRTLTLVVVPKMWTSGPALVRVEWPPDDERLTLVLGELDTVEISGGPAELEVIDSYTASRGASARKALFAPIGASNLPPRSADALGEAENAIVALDCLCRQSGQGALGSATPEAWGAMSSSPVLRPLLHRDLVEEVAGLIHRARRGYTWKDEVLPSIRGRVDATSIAIQQSTHWPVLRCHYEEFDRSTALLRTIVTALCVSAAERTQRPLWSDMEHSTRELAISLRRQLADVSEMSRSLALATARSLRLGPYDSAWTRAVDLASRVLQPSEGLSVRDDQSSAIDVSIDTSRVWERIVFEVLAKTRVRELVDVNGKGESPLTVKRPWVQLGSSGDPPRPDLVLRDDSGWWIIDAKYKRLGSGRLPEIDDQYQMFAYSHLTTAPEVERLALVYPDDGVDRVRTGPFVRAVDDGSRLWVHSIPFPTPDEVVRGWDEYLEAASTGVDEQLLASST